jgi:hypothetical protein
VTDLPGNPYGNHPKHATLALAFEQRTANLIAIWQTSEVKMEGGTYGITLELRTTLFNEIAQRLGLDKIDGVDE